MTTTTRLTLQAFLALPEMEPASEYVNGEVLQKPMPTRTHGSIQLYLGMLLLQYLARTGLGKVVPEWRCIFTVDGQERALVPDLVYVAMGRLTEEEYHRGAPDLVVEIVSPGQAAGRFAEKIQFYLTHGVKLVWVIEPLDQTVLVFVPGQQTRMLHADAILDGGDVLPGFQAPVADIFNAIR